MAAIKNKGATVDLDRLLAVDDSRRQLISQIESARGQRNQLAAESGQTANRQQARRLKDEIARLESEFAPGPGGVRTGCSI